MTAQANRPTIGLLIMVHLSTQLMVAFLVRVLGMAGNPLAHLLFSLLVALSISQNGLVAIWAGLSTSSLGMRIGGALGAAFVLAFVAMISLNEMLPWICIIYLFESAMVVLPLLLVRACGVRLQLTEGSNQRMVLRFSLWNLIIATTVLAGLMAGCRLPFLYADVRQAENLLDAVGIGGSGAIAVLLIAWSVLGVNWGPVRTTTFLAGPALLAPLPLLALDSPLNEDAILFMPLFAATGWIVGGSLLYLRYAGYRLTQDVVGQGVDTTDHGESGDGCLPGPAGAFTIGGSADQESPPEREES